MWKWAIILRFLVFVSITAVICFKNESGWVRACLQRANHKEDGEFEPRRQQWTTWRKLEWMLAFSKIKNPKESLQYPQIWPSSKENRYLG
jgi:hypothetical protein